MRWVVFHYHDRPGGVREVITRGLPALVEHFAGDAEVVLVLGEQENAAWLQSLQARLPLVAWRLVVHPDFGYRSGATARLSPDAAALFCAELTGRDVRVWAHNLSVGRNLPLLRDLPGWCAAAGARLWLQHHDWWWDGRWERWKDWQAMGISELLEAVELTLPVGPNIHHWCVNAEDLPWVRQRAGSAAVWTGVPLPEEPCPTAAETAEAAAWLRSRTNGRKVWLAPVRALRRKNLAESLFLAQQEEEPACLVTTGTAVSAGESSGWRSLQAAALRHGWPLLPSVLHLTTGPSAASKARLPRMAALQAAADVVVLSSLQEGYGLPVIEAARQEKPLLVRQWPGLVSNLAAMGGLVVSRYPTLLVATRSFDARAESARVAARFAGLAEWLPPELSRAVVPEREENSSLSVDFGSLSLTAQLEVLASARPLAGPLPRPEIPSWASENPSSWAARFDPADSTRPPALPGNLLEEVRRRFQYWRQHPLLWPAAEEPTIML